MNDKRRWFQIHLSTAIVIMVVLGGLMWANMIPRLMSKRVRTGSMRVVHEHVENCEYLRSADRFGWPFPFYFAPMKMVEVPTSFPPPDFQSDMEPPDPDFVVEGMDPGALAVDGVIAALTLGFLAAILEARARAFHD